MSTGKPSIASQSEELRRVIGALRASSNSTSIDDATKRLAQIGFKYDEVLYPKLDYRNFTCPAKAQETPDGLAEAYLWKLGHWQKYRKFVRFFNGEEETGDSEDEQHRFVIRAFAHHLQDPASQPIFDQHALRAVWAISKLSPDEEEDFDSFLFNKKGDWKEVGYGKSGVSCLDTFRRIAFALRHGDSDFARVDRMLMPMGKALKSLSSRLSSHPTEERAMFFDIIRPKRHALRASQPTGNADA